jgi:hypothetical protein
VTSALASYEPPGPNGVDDGDDPEAAVEENHVDREAHEERVHGRARAEEQAVSLRQLAATEQAAQPRAEAVGDGTSLADDAPVTGENGLLPFP